MDTGDEEVKPSDDPRCPFSEQYKPQLNWAPLQKLKDNAEAMTKVLEKARVKDPLHDFKQGILLNQHERLLPKKFHVYSKAGAPK